MEKIPIRIAWAVDLLDVQPDDRLLEIGCGTGAAVYAVCDRLVTGSITAIDRSEVMVEKARRRNADLIASGRASVRVAELTRSDLPLAGFDKIFLINLNVFWMDPRDELAEIRRLLAPGGRFYIFHQPPPDHQLEEFSKAFVKNLELNGFAVEEVIENPAGDIFSVAVISRPGVGEAI